jgi:hypothetical protein
MKPSSPALRLFVTAAAWVPLARSVAAGRIILTRDRPELGRDLAGFRPQLILTLAPAGVGPLAGVPFLVR